MLAAKRAPRLPAHTSGRLLSPPAQTATARVVCTAAARNNTRTHSTTPPLRATLAVYPCPHTASFSSSLPYPHASAQAQANAQQKSSTHAYPSVGPHQTQHRPLRDSSADVLSSITTVPTPPHPSNQTFYRRELPPNLHSFTSPAGRTLFKESVAAGTAEIYFSLSGNFTMQSEPAYCGLGSLAMVLNALAVDPGRRWKGVWRWYSDEMLECCAPREQIRKKGMTFTELACLARCNGLRVTAKRADQVSRDQFKKDLARVSASEDTHMVVSFSRKTLGQTGDGHFSPIGAYHAEKNQVLVLDTARFKYPSYFVDADVLYDSMHPVDAETGLPRGYFLFTKGAAKPVALCSIAPPDAQTQHDWQNLAKLFSHDLPAAFRLAEANNLLAFSTATSEDAVDNVLTQILASLPTKLPFLIGLKSPGVDLASTSTSLAVHHANEIRDLINQIQTTALFPHVRSAFRSPVLLGAFPNANANVSPAAHERVLHALATVFLLAAPREVFAGLPGDVRRRFEEVRARGALEPLVRGEVERIAEQIEVLFNSFCKCGKKKHVDGCT
ncbi:hypothetical protein HKX48_005671 [Thoreauomyces humboldtii]|nr:hypothetical protein HKX48_005671 [Thoreauomyces humboldtii]